MRLIILAAVVLSVLVLAGAGLAQRCLPKQVLHPSGDPFDYFGATVALSGDTMIVGASGDDVTADSQGSAHVYRWTGTAWMHEATLVASDPTTSQQLGWSVAISGDTAVVGAVGANGTAQLSTGAAYVFVRTGGVWSQQAKLLASDGVTNDSFGWSVAVSGDTALVSAILHEVGANFQQGAAYVFTRTGASWTQQAILTGSTSLAGERYGTSVALDDQTAIVGSANHNVGANLDQGAAFVYTRTGSSWSEQARLTAADGAAQDLFGSAVSISGDTVLIGAVLDSFIASEREGSAYAFTRSGTTWTQQAKLIAPQGGFADEFGFAVCVRGESAIVGVARRNVGANTDQGVAMVFTRSGATWSFQSQLFAPDGAAFDGGTYAVAIDGDRAVIGVRNDDIGSQAEQGSVWVHERVEGVWQGQTALLTASDGVPGDYFGAAVDVDGDTMVVGARDDDNGANANQGSAYVFTRLNGAWVQQVKLLAPGGGAGDEFGASVAIDGDFIVVGAPNRASLQGGAYVYRRESGIWSLFQPLVPSGIASGARFGNDVAIDGNTIAVAAFLDDAVKGSVFVFTRSTGSWTQQGPRLQASDGSNDVLGNSVALEGDTIVAGAPDDDNPANGQGSVVVFTRSGTTWTQRIKLFASDPEALASFGWSVSLDNGTLLVGAYLAQGVVNQAGATYVFTGSGATWTQQARLIAPDGAANDNFGRAVTLDGDVALIGSPLADIAGRTDQGALYVFGRLGSTWTMRGKLTAFDGLANDIFAFGEPAISDGMVFVGARRQVGANFQQGSVYVLPAGAECVSAVQNLTLNVPYATLSAALLPAQSGHQISGSAEAWSSITTLDTLGRSIGFSSSAWLATPEGSTLTLGGSSFLAAAGGEPVEVYGQLRISANASADVIGGGFVLGSRGILTARTGSSLTISAPAASLAGQTRLEQGSALTFAGAAANTGLFTASVNSTISADGPIASSDELFLTAGTITAPSYTNTGATSIFGSSAVFGDYINGSGATTTIRSGSLFVFGSLTNNGTIVGTICANCAGSPPNLDVLGSLTLGAGANLVMPFTGSFVRVGGNFDCAIDSNTRFDLSIAELALEGTGAEQTLEAMSRDRGRCASALNRSAAGNYPVGVLHIGPSPSVVRLVDAHDNDGGGQTRAEAVYVDTLRIDAGSRLANTGFRVYYNTLVNNGTVDVPANLFSIGGCRADFNNTGTVSVQDIFDFLAAYFAADPRGDFNCSGAISVQDIFDFLAAYFAGCN